MQSKHKSDKSDYQVMLERFDYLQAAYTAMVAYCECLESTRADANLIAKCSEMRKSLYAEYSAALRELQAFKKPVIV